MNLKKIVFGSIFLVFLVLMSFLSLFDLERIFNKKGNPEIVANTHSSSTEQIFYPANYKEDFKRIYTEYYSRKESDKLDLAYIKGVQLELLKMKVPVEYRDLHLKMVFSVELMEKYLSGGESENKASSDKIFNELKENNSWLN